MSLEVSCFFSGLALGSYLGGRLADTTSRPLLAYGILEFALGVLSFGVVFFLSRWEIWFPSVAAFLSPFLPFSLRI